MAIPQLQEIGMILKHIRLFFICRYLFNTWWTKRASNYWNSSFISIWIIFIKAFDWILPINFDAAFKWCRPQKTAMGKIKTSSKQP